MARKRTEQKKKTRERIVDAAFGLFCERGIVATRTADVAERAGISHGALFVHFPRRDELVAEVIAVHSQEVIERVQQLVEREGADLGAVLRAHLDGLRAHEIFYARLVTEGPLLPSYARSCLLGIQSVISLQLGEVAARERDAGRIREMPLPLLFNTWIGLVHHYLINRDLFAPGKSVLEERGEELIEHFVALVKT